MPPASVKVSFFRLWSILKRHQETTLSPSERVDVKDMFERMKAHLPHGSTVLLRVKPSDYGGLDVVPVVVGRKAPSPWDRSFAADGMFAEGDIMVWIHSLLEAEGMGNAAFHVPSDFRQTRNERAAPLACIVALGMPMATYLTNQQTPHGHWVLRKGAMKTSRTHGVLMCVKPTPAFRAIMPGPLSVTESARSPLSEVGMFGVSTNVQRRFRTPVVFREDRQLTPAWRGVEGLGGTVSDMVVDHSSRWYSYRVKWKASSLEVELVGLPGIPDGGAIERYRVTDPPR